MSQIEASAARFSPDGTMLAVLGHSYGGLEVVSDTLTLWDLRTGKIIWQSKQANIGSMPLSVATVKFSADGSVLACPEVAGRPGLGFVYTIRLRDAHTGKPLDRQTFRGDFTGFAISPDGRTIALNRLRRQSEVQIVDTVSGRTLRTLDGVNFGDPGWDVAFSPDGRYLAARPNNIGPPYILNNPELIVWETGTGKCLYHSEEWRNPSWDGPISPPHVCLDPVFFTSNTRLVCSDWILDLDRKPLQLRGMIPPAHMYTTLGVTRLFVGFVDNEKAGQGTHAHLALFHADLADVDDPKDRRTGVSDIEVKQFEVWDIATQKRVRGIRHQNEPCQILDYSQRTHLIARCDANGILSLQRL